MLFIKKNIVLPYQIDDQGFIKVGGGGEKKRRRGKEKGKGRKKKREGKRHGTSGRRKSKRTEK